MTSLDREVVRRKLAHLAEALDGFAAFVAQVERFLAREGP